TGRGTPIANLMVADFVGSSPTPSATHFRVTTSTGSPVAGVAFGVTVTALDASGNVVSGYKGTVHFTSSDGQAVLPADYPFTTADSGAHSFSATLKQAGSQTITVTDTSVGATNGSAAVTVTPAAPNKLAFGQQPTNTAPGAV